MDDVIIIVINILQEINYQKYTIYQLSNRHSTQYINYRCKKIYFTVVICVYLIVLYFFCIKQSLSNLSSFYFSFYFQPMDSDMHAHAHSWPSSDGTETSKTTNFQACFFYNIYL